MATCQLPVESDHQRGRFHIRNRYYGCDELLGSKRQQSRAESEQFITGAYDGPAAVTRGENDHRGHPIQLFQVKDGEWPVSEPQRGEQGIVRAEAAVRGHVRDVRVISGLPHGLTEAAIAVVKSCRYSPGEKDGKAVPFVSDFFDFSIYLDADEDVLLSWYVNRFLTLRGTAFVDPKSYFHRYAKLSDREATATATSIWTRINLLNLHENILPTRQRADLILKKGESHQIKEVALRRL